MQTLSDKVFLAAVKAAKTIADKATPTDEEKALGRLLVLGQLDQRLVAICSAIWGDTDGTTQANVDSHVSLAVPVLLKLGVG